MRQTEEKFSMFSNRLTKLFRHRSKQAARSGISCYRLYDHDLPEFPLIIEIFGSYASVSEYKRRHGMDDAEHEAWLEGTKAVIAQVSGIAADAIYFRMRKRKEGRGDQYTRISEDSKIIVVQEAGLNFKVNLTDYLDTGLFLDHRLTRGMVKEAAAGKSVLNLFCYTGSFSVYALSGGAERVESVDLSNTYLNWTLENIKLNALPEARHKTVKADVLQYLNVVPAASFDIIVMDPPTFSNSKSMEGILDIQRDHVALVKQCLRILKSNGSLYFSTNATKFVLDEEALMPARIKDITRATTPFDFEGKLKRLAWLIQP